MNNDTSIDVESFNVQVLEEPSEEQFIMDVYTQICVKCNRLQQSGIYLTDFYFETIPIYDSMYYYIGYNHPITQILLVSPSSGFEPEKQIGVHGDIESTVYIYHKNALIACIEKLKDLCNKYNLKIIQ